MEVRDPYVSPDRQLPGADAIEETIKRNVKRYVPLIVACVKALRKDGRPPFTEKISPTERLMRLLEAPQEFWDELMNSDFETATKLVADVIKARLAGKIPQTGPLAEQAAKTPEDDTALNLQVRENLRNPQV